MNISQQTLTAIGRIVTGDERLSPYRSGPQLVRLFNDYGANNTYGQGFPSRWQYAEDRLCTLNGTQAIGSLICQVLDPREFMDTDFKIQEACDYVNNRLRYDGFEIVIDGGLAKIRDLKGVSVVCKHPFEGSDEEGHIFIDEQIKKAEKKIQDGDYDGAITNARSLLEATLTEIEKQLDGTPSPYDGDLPKLYKRVQKVLGLDPSRPDVEGPMKQLLTGLVSIVGGLSGLSNRMSDRHVRSYKPSAHHAAVIVNSAKTVANFLFETHKCKKDKSKLARHS